MRVAAHFVLPIDDVAAGVERRPRAAHHGRPVRLPVMLLLAHPLHAHRPAGQSAREQSRVGCRIVGAVVAVAARAFHVDAAHLLLGKAQHLGDRLAQREHALRVRPDGQRIAIERSDGAGRPDRAVHLVGTAIHGLQRPRGGRRLRVLVGDDMIFSRQGLDNARDVCFVRKLRRDIPFCRRSECMHRGHRLELALGDDAKKAAVAHDLDDARHFFGITRVDRLQPRAIAWRPHHTRMHHARQAQVVHVADAAGHFSRDIDARQRLADDFQRVGGFQLRCRLCGHMQDVAGNQIAVGGAAIIGPYDRARLGAQPIRRDTKTLRRDADQDFPHLRRRVADGASPLSCIELLPEVKPSFAVRAVSAVTR